MLFTSAERKSRVQFEQSGEFMGLIAKVGVRSCGWVSGLVSWVKWVGFIRASFGYQGAAECNMSPGLGG